MLVCRETPAGFGASIGIDRMTPSLRSIYRQQVRDHRITAASYLRTMRKARRCGDEATFTFAMLRANANKLEAEAAGLQVKLAELESRV